MSDASQIFKNQNWTLSKKIAFRFFFILFLLYILVNNNGAFPSFQIISNYPVQLTHVFIPWFAKNIIHYTYDYTIFNNGSGDTSYNYVLILILFLTSVLGCIVWSALDHKRKNYDRLYYWLLLFVRFFVAFSLIHYGMVKIIKLQFPYPSLFRLNQAYGNSTPMGLAWTFLGFSKGYNVFMGVIEVSSILLLFRRTLVAGAFLSLAASVHVMAMNYFYDIPVKIFSTTLVLMCLFILAPNFSGLYRFFIKNELEQLKQIIGPVYKKRWQVITVCSIKYIIIVYTLALLINSSLIMVKQYGEEAPKSVLYGIYDIEQFSVNKKEILPLTTDRTRWKQITFSGPDYASIKLMNDSILNISIKTDPKKKEVEFTDNYLYKLKYKFSSKNLIIFTGVRAGDSLFITLKRKDLKEFKLTNRDFHWVNEYPNNK